MAISVGIDLGSMAGTFKVGVDGNAPAMLWIKWYSTTADTIAEPAHKETPYDDLGGTLVVDALRSPTFPYSTSDISLPPGTRWVLAIVWALDASNATLIRSSTTREFTPPPTTTSTSSTSTSSTTESSTTGSSTTSSTTTASSTTSGSPGMATWTWQNVGGVNQWVLTTPCSSGTASAPGFNGMMPGDTAQTTCS